MKKLAFPIALITSITAWCLCAFLFPLIAHSLTCVLAYSSFPKSMLDDSIIDYACHPTDPAPPPPPPLTLSPTASVPVTNTDLHLSFKHPEGWALLDSSISRSGQSLYAEATYRLPGQPGAPTFKITYYNGGGPISPDDQGKWVRYYLNHVVGRYGAYSVAVEELRETIDGVPAGGVRDISGRQVRFRLTASQPDQTNDFEWTSDYEYFDELEQIYRAMLPTIRFGSLTAPPASVDTVPHAFVPTPLSDILLDSQVSPELRADVHGGLSLLKACSPETWAFVHTYVRAINVNPDPKVNYNTIRYPGVILLSQTAILSRPKSIREFAAMSMIVHQSRHLWQRATNFTADPDEIERDAYRFELRVYDHGDACSGTVIVYDSIHYFRPMRRNVEEAIKNPLPAPP